MTKLKISLIIPAYNEEKYIWNCLKYALKNKEYFHEIIVVDNNSTDTTKQVAESYPWVRVFTEVQKWPTFARQRWYRESTGDILAFADADTHMPAGWAKKVHDQFVRDSNLWVLSGPCTFYDMSKYNDLYSWIYPPIFISYITAQLFWWVCYGGNFAIRRTVLEKINGFDTSITFYGDDSDIACRAKPYARVKYMLGLKMDTSFRRYKGQGVFSTEYQYVKQYIRTTIFHKTPPKEYEDYR